MATRGLQHADGEQFFVHRLFPLRHSALALTPRWPCARKGALWEKQTKMRAERHSQVKIIKLAQATSA